MPTTPQRRPQRPGPTGKGREARDSQQPPLNPEAQGLTSRLAPTPDDEPAKARRTKSVRATKSHRRPKP